MAERPCVVCGTPSSGSVWRYPVCGRCFLRWQAECEPPPEQATEAHQPVEILCEAWTTRTRAFLGQLARELRQAQAAGGAA